MPSGDVAHMEAGHLAIAFKLLGLHMLLLFLLLRLQLKPHDPPLIMLELGEGCSSLISSPTACSGLHSQLKHSYNAGTLLRGPGRWVLAGRAASPLGAGHESEVGMRHSGFTAIRAAP